MEDLSHLINQDMALTGGESMAAGNTINHPITVVGPAPGSIPVNAPPAADELDDTGLGIPPVKAYTRKPNGSYSH
jgi:hypothetical protein